MIKILSSLEPLQGIPIHPKSCSLRQTALLSWFQQVLWSGWRRCLALEPSGSLRQTNPIAIAATGRVLLFFTVILSPLCVPYPFIHSYVNRHLG